MSFIAQKDLTMSVKFKLSKLLWGLGWLNLRHHGQKTRYYSKFILSKANYFPWKKVDSVIRSLNFWALALFFFLIERSNEIYYPTAQSREQIMRVQISRDIVQLFRQLIISHRKKTCLTSWLHLPSLVPYLTTVPCLLVKSLQLLKYRQRLIQSVVALWSSRMMKMKCSFGNYFHMQRAHPCL